LGFDQARSKNDGVEHAAVILKNCCGVGMIGKSVDTITVEDIKSLVANQVAENRTLEYKE
jgi:hypothetical protein